MIEAGTTAGPALGSGPNIVAAKVNGELRDLAYQVAEGDLIENGVWVADAVAEIVTAVRDRVQV